MLVALIFAGSGLAIALAAVPLARGRVRRNPAFGARTGETLSDDAIWEPVNRRAGREMILVGILTAGWGMLNVVWQPVADELLNVLLALALLIAGLMTVAVRSYLHGIRLKRAAAGRY